MAELTTAPNDIPQDFAPRLESEMLTLPDKTFVFARWAMAAMQQSEMREAMGSAFDVIAAQTRAGAPIDRGTMANMEKAMSAGMGGPLDVSGGLVFPDMIKFQAEAKRPGDNIMINRPRFLNSPTTIASRTIASSAKFFGGNTQPVTMDQISVAIRELVGPLDGTSAFAPISISLFAQHRAFHDLLSYARLNLVRDRVKFLDDNIISILLAMGSANTDGIVRGGDVASNAAFTGVTNEPFTFDLLPKASEVFGGPSRGIPGVGGGRRYIAVLDTHQKQQLQNDSQWGRLVQFFPEMNPVFPGYVGETNDFILCESNNIPRLTNGGAGANLTLYQAILLAPEALAWGLAMPPRLLRDKNDDGDRFARVGWHAFEGWSATNDQYEVTIITD